MKRIVPILFCSAVAVSTVCGSPFDPLETGFRNPPHQSNPHTWFHLMNGNVTKAGITKDFEALAEIGVGGVQMFDAGCDIPAGSLAFNSTEWFDLLKHAALESKRLGLEICLPNCSGWSSSGGPWVAPSNGMMMVDWTATDVLMGPCTFNGKLKAPEPPAYAPFYRDVAVLAVPVPPAELQTFPGKAVIAPYGAATFVADGPVIASGIEYRFAFSPTWGLYGSLEIETSADGEHFEKVGIFTANPCISGSRDTSLRTLVFTKPLSFRALRATFRYKSGMKPETLTIEDLRPCARAALTSLPAKRFAMRAEEPRDTFATTLDQVVSSGTTVNLSTQMAADGTLVWKVPEGAWKIFRIGVRANGRRNHPASAHGIGLEVDKFSSTALNNHFDTYIGRLCDVLGPDLVGHADYGLNNILVDSYEVGSQTWTPGFEKIFKARMGYDLTPYLPVLLGYVVDSTAVSERFLEDYRRVIADLFAENYAGALVKKCHERGLLLSLEPYGNSPSDNLQYGREVDIPMAEFWSFAGNPYQNACGNSKLAASLAHVWGRKFVATESFTASGSRPGGGNNGPGSGGWRTTPFDLKAQCDGAYAAGVNRIIYHRFVHQPWVDVPRIPGMTMGKWGMHFDRTQTWWTEGREWIRYQSRCQWLLQEGRFVGDILFYCGEEVPNRGGDTTDGTGRLPQERLPEGYNYDLASRETIRALKVENGLLVVPSGVTYSVLAMPDSDTASPELLRVIGKLADAGAMVVMNKKPIRAPGLADYPQRDQETQRLANELYANGVRTCSVGEALTSKSISPDCLLSHPTERGLTPVWIHRHDDQSGADWYFIAANNRKPMTFSASFRVTGRVPELWDAERGTIMRARRWKLVDGRTEVTFDLPICGSMFVVLRGQAKGVQVEKKRVPISDSPVIGAWNVAFPHEFKPNALAEGVPETVSFDELADWAKRPEEGIRHFSGTAIYTKTVEGVKLDGSRILLDLGEVKHFATVTVNGKIFPALWKPPYIVDITDALSTLGPQPVTLNLSIRVTNLWPNKLIGDAQKGEDCEWIDQGVHGEAIKTIPSWVNEGKPSPTGRDTFITWRHWKATDQLQPSGLLGPVKLELFKEEEK